VTLVSHAALLAALASLTKLKPSGGAGASSLHSGGPYMTYEARIGSLLSATI